MPNENYPQEKSELYAQIERQAGKVNFLDNQLTRCKMDSFIAPNIEIEFMDRGFKEIMDKIKDRCNLSAFGLISEQLMTEEAVLKNLSKQAIKD